MLQRDSRTQWTLANNEFLLFEKVAPCWYRAALSFDSPKKAEGLSPIGRELIILFYYLSQLLAEMLLHEL